MLPDLLTSWRYLLTGVLSYSKASSMTFHQTIFALCPFSNIMQISQVIKVSVENIIVQDIFGVLLSTDY